MGYDAAHGNSDLGLGLTFIRLLGGTGLQSCLNHSKVIVEPVHKCQNLDGECPQNPEWYFGVYGLGFGFPVGPNGAALIGVVHLSLFLGHLAPTAV